MQFVNEVDTVKALQAGESIARFGDGELSLIYGGSAIAQSADPALTKALMKTMHSDRICVGVPLVCDRPPVPNHEGYWRTCSKRLPKLLKAGKTYYSAFISRGDLAPHINNEEYFENVRAIWDNRRVIVVQGHGARFNKAGIIDNAKSFVDIRCPNREAWFVKDDIVNRVLTEVRDSDLIILSLGPCATVLARLFAERGYQALDLGALGRFYSKLKGMRPR